MNQKFNTIPMKNPTKYYTKSHIDSLIKNCKRYRDKLLIYTLAKTGRRVSEIVRCLKPSHINATDGLILFTILKRKKPLQLLLPADPKLIDKLVDYIEAKQISQHTPIFDISRQRADQIIKEAAEKAGLPNAHAHMFRHSFAIEGAKKAKNPADLVQLKDMLGHASIDTTMFYLRFNPKQQREMLKNMWG